MLKVQNTQFVRKTLSESVAGTKRKTLCCVDPNQTCLVHVVTVERLAALAALAASPGALLLLQTGVL